MNAVKTLFVTKLVSNYFNEFDKIYIYSPSLHQVSYQKKIKCFSIYVPFNKNRNFFIDEDLDIVIDEIVNNKDFQKADTEIETYESKEALNYPQEHEDGGIII